MKGTFLVTYSGPRSFVSFNPCRLDYRISVKIQVDFSIPVFSALTVFVTPPDVVHVLAVAQRVHGLPGQVLGRVVQELRHPGKRSEGGSGDDISD